MPISPLRFGAYWSAAGVLLLSGCLDTGQSPPVRSDQPSLEDPEGLELKPVDLIYVCGNKFLATNGTTAPVHLTYRVVETKETGALTVEQGPGEDPGYSETELETTQPGTVELYHNDERVARRVNGGLSCGSPAMSASVAGVAAGTPATAGQWSAPFSWPHNVAVHLHLLRTGKVLSWGKFGTPAVWDPTSKAFTTLNQPDWLFCSGHSFLADGKLLVNGGHISDDHGIPDANIFDPATLTWTSRPAMARGRWYPTTTTLPNGEAVTIAGRDQNGMVVTIPEVWTGSTWRKLTGAAKSLPYYPRTFVAPDGRIFYAGETQATFYLSTSGTGRWTAVGNRKYGSRNFGSAVMYEPGKILYAGGGRTTNTAEIIDLNQANPVWQFTGPMRFARRHLNATLLPTGQVLVMGGTSGTGFSDENQAIYAAELWDPKSKAWTTLASNSVKRVYHSTALLLRDGRVLLTGSGDAAGNSDHRDAELFSPPYLFKGARPGITSGPASVNYNETFLIGTGNPAAISRVTLLRMGSVTHAFDANQRFNELSFVRTTGGVSVTAPAKPSLAPPGYYMLFILNGNDVPSTGKIIRIK